jgi:4-amino-4-deoxy-L-arabinose transferase-like glycosyltransferase
MPLPQPRSLIPATAPATAWRLPALPWRLALLSRLRLELAALALIAGTLDLWGLARNGWANEYYAAAVRSMSSSWHNFLFASMDASGVMTVDKPPLALWVQSLSARIFGFHSLSLLIPEALMGVAAVALTYDLVRRCWGRVAGFAAGLVLALTPIAVAVSRHNNPDALLVLCSVAAVWFTVRALQDGRTRWLVLAGVSVGLGFETKMGAALLVVPGIAAAWLWAAPRRPLQRLRALLAGGVAMVGVGGAWPLLVALTPAANRPWISGTSDNSVISLILGYNGLGRLNGQAGGPQAFGGGAGGGAGGGGLFGGSPEVLRLFGADIGGQAGWLVGFALVAGVAILVASRLRRSDPRSGWVLAVGGAFAVCVVAFSFAKGIFHPYYVSLLAPFVAALVGAGVAQLAARGWLLRLLAPLAVAAGIATELLVLNRDATSLSWAPTLVLALGVPVVVALIALNGRRLRTALLLAALAVLLAAPATWAAQTLGHASNGTFPAGGPATAGFGGPGGGPGRRPAGGGSGGFGAPPTGLAPPGGAPPTTSTTAGVLSSLFGGAGAGSGQRPGGGPGFGGDAQSLDAVANYVKRHGGGAIATSSQSAAASAIVGSGANVVGIGGFSGRESAVSVKWFAGVVRAGRVRWVLSGNARGGPGGDTRSGSQRVMTLVSQTCRRIPTASYASSSSAGAGRSTSAGVLYDCAGRADALLAASGS